MNKYTFTLRAQEMSTNRLIPYGFVDATAVDIETGLTENNAATQLSDFLPVTPGESYVIMQVLNARYESATIGCYDINQNFIQGYADQSAFLAPDTCYFVRLTLPMNADAADYGLFLHNRNEDTANIFNPDDVSAGRLNTTSGAVVADSYHWVTGYISVQPSTAYRFLTNEGNAYRPADMVFYNAAKNRIGEGAASSFTTAATCRYVRFAVTNAFEPNNLALLLSSAATFTPYFTEAEFVRYEVFTEQEAHPNYSDGLAIDYERESGQQFFRKKLSESITFLGEDYDFIMSRPLEDTLYIDLLESGTPVFSGLFHRTDCTVNVDDHTIAVTPQPNDDYQAVLDGYEREYDLLPLSPVIESVRIDKRPLVQVYVPGDTIVTCYLRGMTWEQDCEAVTDLNELAERYSFSLDSVLKEMTVSGDGLPLARGVYAGSMAPASTPESYEGALYPRWSNGYYIWVRQVRDPGGWRHWFASCQLRRISDNETLYSYRQESSSGNDFDSKEFTMTAASGEVAGTMDVDMFSYNLFARYLCDVESVRGQATTPIASDDMVGDNRNYRYVLGLSLGMGYISNQYSTSPTEFGRASGGYYYTKPLQQVQGQSFFAVARSTWRTASLWISPRLHIDAALEKSARKSYILRDAFPVWSAIQVLLKQVAPKVKHAGTEEYSEFLYGTANPLSGDTFTLLLSPKSNILSGEYTQPAQKAPTTLRQVLSMLASVYQCYWYIDGGKLRIEHISFFKNGGSYSSVPSIGRDLTEEINTRNGKALAYATSQYSFEKEEMPERYSFGWMDDVTLPFTGMPIEVISQYVKQDRTEDVNVTNFTSDVDYMLLNPEECSPDGFALLAANPANLLLRDDSNLYPLGGCVGRSGLTSPEYPVSGMAAGSRVSLKLYGEGNGLAEVFFRTANGVVATGVYVFANGTAVETAVDVPAGATALVFYAMGSYVHLWVYSMAAAGANAIAYADRTVNGVEYTMQNGLLAFSDLQPKYWRYDMPAGKLLINGIETTALTRSRRKVQEVRYPSPVAVDEKKLIKTFIGNAEISKISVNLLSETATATLRHDTE